MTTPASSAVSAGDLPDYAPVPRSALGPAANAQGYYVGRVDPTPYFQKYGENTWAAMKSLLDQAAATAAAPVIEKYTGVLAAADVFTESTTFSVMQSIRLDLGSGFDVHP